jgi:hypothetical protein
LVLQLQLQLAQAQLELKVLLLLRPEVGQLVLPQQLQRVLLVLPLLRPVVEQLVLLLLQLVVGQLELVPVLAAWVLAAFPLQELY